MSSWILCGLLVCSWVLLGWSLWSWRIERRYLMNAVMAKHAPEMAMLERTGPRRKKDKPASASVDIEDRVAIGL